MNKPAITAITLLSLLGTAQAMDYPVLKEGLWKLHMVTKSNSDKPEDNTFFLCRDHAYDNRTNQLAAEQMKKCTSISDSTTFGKRTLSMTCKVAGSTMVSKGVITSTGDTFYHSDTTTTIDPPMYGQSTSEIIQDQTWVGPCPAGMGPGDRKMADGTIQHHR